MVRHRSFWIAHDQILVVYTENIIDGIEFLLLLESQWKLIWKQSFTDFGFGKNDHHTILDVFNIPNRITTVERTVFPDIKAL